MKRSGYFTFGLIFMCIALLSVWSCGDSSDKETASKNGSGKKDLSGSIRISGAWALYPMVVSWGEEFNKVHPEVRIDVSAGGAGKGVADALAELVDIGMVSRELRTEEIQQGAFYVPVAKDAVFPTINSNNPVLQRLAGKGIRKSTLIDLWVHGKILTWGEMGGDNSTEKINIYTRSDSCGAAETWANYLDGNHQEDLQGVGVYGDPGLADAVKQDPFGIGYNNLNYAYDANSGLPVQGLQIIPVDINENGRVDPEEELKTKKNAINAVSLGIYPSPPARVLYLITKESFKGPAKEFIKWILTSGQQNIEEVGYIKLNDAQMTEALKKIGL